MWRQPELRPASPKRAPTGETNRHTGDVNERIAARRLELRRVDGSGCGLREKGDLGSGSPFHVEAKASRLPVMRLQRRWADKAVRQADAAGKRYVVLQLAVAVGAPTSARRWVAVRAEDLARPPRRERALAAMRLDDAVPADAPTPYRLWPDAPARWLLFPETWFTPRRFRRHGELDDPQGARR